MPESAKIALINQIMRVLCSDELIAVKPHYGDFLNGLSSQPSYLPTATIHTNPSS